MEFLEARLDNIARFAALATGLRKRGFLVVMDDVGAGHSNLDRIPLFRPDVIKIDRSLVTGVEADFYKQETFKSLVSCRGASARWSSPRASRPRPRRSRRSGSGRICCRVTS